MNRAPALLASFAALGSIVLAVACGDLKTADPSNAADGGASSSTSSGSGANTSGSSGTNTTSSSGTASSSGTPLGPGGAGAGPYGALPFGYCCTDDSECRDRHCVQVGSSKMCLDDCRYPETCQGKTLPDGFTCDGTPSETGLCQPPSGFTCLPASSFNLGTKSALSCCTQTNNGTNGLECAGGHCFYYKASQDPGYTPPEFCTNRCELPQDCGQGMKCQLQLGYCVPANEVFECE